MSKAHPGFTGAAEQIAQREGYSMERARKILGYAKAHASAKAKKANPHLRNTPGHMVAR